MRKLSLLIIISFCFTACFKLSNNSENSQINSSESSNIISESSEVINDNHTKLFGINYTNQEIDKVLLDDYFTNNEKYSSYPTLKKNTPDLLDNIKTVDITCNLDFSKIQIVRFSSSDKNGFLIAATFILDKTNPNETKVFSLGASFGGYGVTQFVLKKNKTGSWIYFLYSFGSGVHSTSIGAYEIGKYQSYSFNSIGAFANKDYSLALDGDKISIFNARIQRTYDDKDFPSFEVTPNDLVIDNILDFEMTKL